MVAAQLDMHQARDAFGRRRIAVETDPLDQRGRTVAYPDDADPNFAQDLTPHRGGAHRGASGQRLLLSRGCLVQHGRSDDHPPVRPGRV